MNIKAIAVGMVALALSALPNEPQWYHLATVAIGLMLVVAGVFWRKD
jgi:hypothetical protein